MKQIDIKLNGLFTVNELTSALGACDYDDLVIVNGDNKNTLHIYNAGEGATHLDITAE